MMPRVGSPHRQHLGGILVLDVTIRQNQPSGRGHGRTASIIKWSTNGHRAHVAGAAPLEVARRPQLLRCRGAANISGGNMKIRNGATLAAGMLVGCAFMFAAVTPARGAMTLEGKKASYKSLTGVAIPQGPPVTVATLAIEKGKKKRVLEVDATIVETSNVATGIGLIVEVNGVAMEPTGATYQVIEGCSASLINCTVQGTYWLDLDQAEAANPGVFINQPLVITLQATSAGSPSTGNDSLRWRLVKP